MEKPGIHFHHQQQNQKSNKKGLKFKKKGTLLNVHFKEPLQFTYEESIDVILETVMDAIEQSKKFMMKSKHHLITALDK